MILPQGCGKEKAYFNEQISENLLMIHSTDLTQVCGKGKTYSNKCQAACAKVKYTKKGACKKRKKRRSKSKKRRSKSKKKIF